LGIQNWIKEIKNSTEEDCKIMMIGNKCDMVDSRQVDLKEAQEFAKKNEMFFMETSASENINVEDAFIQLLKEIYTTSLSDEKKEKKSTNEMVVNVLQKESVDENMNKKNCC
jgi:GTPase SAR1 family protein